MALGKSSMWTCFAEGSGLRQGRSSELETIRCFVAYWESRELRITSYASVLEQRKQGVLSMKRAATISCSLVLLEMASRASGMRVEALPSDRTGTCPHLLICWMNLCSYTFHTSELRAVTKCPQSLAPTHEAFSDDGHDSLSHGLSIHWLFDKVGMLCRSIRF